jgi:rhamnogalacturonyl hydrolase YesR
MLQSLFVVILSIACLQSSYAAPPSSTPEPTPDSVKALTQKVADWQIETFDEHGKYRALPAGKKESWRNTDNYHDLMWQMAALYIGMQQWSGISDDPKYTKWLEEIGERNDWKLHQRPYHADDHAVGQVYLSLHQQSGDPAMLKPTRDHFDWILAHPITGSLTWGKDTDCLNRWGWCDALFMAPPVWARLAEVTGDQKYLDFMDQEFHASYDLLWDKEEKLFWRDSSYFARREQNGKKFFWARGNGWVLGGLALMIPDLPQDWEGRQFYVDLYRQMAARIKEIQREDGTWSMGLLGGAEGYPMKETSGTSFFTFGLAWGVNNGLLDRATYEPVVHKAWNALTQCVTPDGMLVYVQPVGAAPGDSFADKTEVYGIGAFLAAGAEVYKMLSGTMPAGAQIHEQATAE